MRDSHRAVHCRFLEQLVSDTDRNIRRNKERVDRDNANKQVALSKDTLVQVEALAKQIAELHQSAEKLGEEGNLDESMAAMAKAETLLTQKKTLENPVNASKEKIMEVCEICCNFMTVSDRESESEAAKARIAEHLNGKQHQAWEKIRNKLAELRAMNEGKGPPPKPRPGMSASGGDGERRRSRSPRRDDRDRRSVLNSSNSPTPPRPTPPRTTPPPNRNLLFLFPSPALIDKLQSSPTPLHPTQPNPSRANPIQHLCLLSFKSKQICVFSILCQPRDRCQSRRRGLWTMQNATSAAV